MAIAEITNNISVTLHLTEEEAKWLKGVVQNPIGGHPDDEYINEKEMRMAFWNALNRVDIKP